MNLNRIKNRRNQDTHLWVKGGPLILASEKGHVEMVEHLLALGADPCLHDNIRYYKDNAYEIARQNNQVDVLVVLENHQPESTCVDNTK